MTRDPLAAGALLRQAAAGFEHGDAFVEHALQRLATGDLMYGDRWSTLPAATHLREMREEAADLGCWGTLAVQVATPVQAVVVRRAVLTAARHGAAAHAAIDCALNLLEPGDATAMTDQRDQGPRANGQGRR